MASPSGSPLILPGRNNAALWLDGAATFASVPLVLASFNQISVSAWLWWNAFANNDALAMEYSANQNTNNGVWIFDPNSSGTSTFLIGTHTAGGYGQVSFARPSAKAWHHYLAVFDLSQTGDNQIAAVYVDGVKPSLTTHGGVATAASLGNFTLYLMSRGGASLFGAGAVAQLALWAGVVLRAADALALYNGADPRAVSTGATHFWRLDGKGGQPNLGRFGAGAGTVTTTAAGMLALPAQIAPQPAIPRALAPIGAGGGAAVTVDCSGPIEWAHSVLRAAGGPFEAPRRIGADTVSSFGSGGSTLRSSNLAASILTEARSDQQPPMENGAGLGTAARTFTEALFEPASDVRFWVESTGNVAVQRDVTPPVEFVISLPTAAALPSETRLSLLSACGAAAEVLAGRSAFCEAPAAWTGAVLVAADTIEELELAVIARRGTMVAIEWLTSGLTSIGTAASLPIEWQALPPAPVVVLPRLLRSVAATRLISTPGRIRLLRK